MKVHEIIKKVELSCNQNITVFDLDNCKSYVSSYKYGFALDFEVLERIYNLNVQSFEFDESGITIFAD